VTYSGTYIKYLNKPSEAVQIAAVRSDSYAIRYIKRPKLPVQLAAIEIDPESHRYIKKPHEKAIQLAVTLSPHIYVDIENPSPKVQLIAVEGFWYNLAYITEQTEEMVLVALRQDIEAKQFIRIPLTEAIICELVTQSLKG